MARFRNAESILAAAEQWKERCLLGERSLFTDLPLWTRSNFQELQALYVENLDDLSSDSFPVKLERQLRPGSPDAKCLWAELTWVYHLIQDSRSMGPATKRGRIGEIWKWSGREFPEGHELLEDSVLGAGVVGTGRAYTRFAWMEFRFFAVAMLGWFSLGRNERESLFAPWGFASWVDATEFASNRMFRHALLFLLFPDEFEPIVSSGYKATITQTLGNGETPEDGVQTDKALLGIRRRLERESDRQEVHFYEAPFIEFWQQDKAEEWYQAQFDGRGVWQMNMNVVGEEMWPKVAEDGLASIGWDEIGDLRRSQAEIRQDLIDRGYGPDPRNRALFLWEFANKMEDGDIVIATRKGGWLIGWGRVTSDYQFASEGGTFRVHTRAVEWRVCTEDIPLLSGSVPVKRLTDFSKFLCWVRLALWLMRDRARQPVEPYSINQAHQDLFFPLDHFTRLVTSIKLRKNLILQGPPGTGKTFIARRLAWCLIGRKDSGPIGMVQFHQSYAYEDFVQGYRPTGDGFELKDGVFHRFCERARAKPDMPHVFIIDEINRGNLSRIFGELLMLIEADKRSDDYAVELVYSEKRFHVPDNVFIIGMMNTADRSLAMVDYALRRRFAFETLEPAFGTAHGRAEFEKYLGEKGADPDLARLISDRMHKLNETIRDEPELGGGFQIGHSYFVPRDGEEPSEDWYRNVVDTQIAPLLREYWFDAPESVEKEVARLTANA